MKTAFVLLLMTLPLHAEVLAPKWQQLPKMPNLIGVAAPFAGVSGGVLLVAGGANFPDKMPWQGGKKVWVDTAWILESPDAKWREAGKLPRPLGYGIAVTHRDSLICVGGSDAERHYPDVFRLRWQNSKLTVETLPALPIPLSGAAGVCVGSILFVACGASEPGEKTATNRAFSLELDSPDATWRELPPLPAKPRILAAAASHDGWFYVLAGAALELEGDGKTARTYLRDAWRYRSHDGWKQIADLPKPNVAAPSPAPVIDGRILLIAGDDGSRVGFQPIDKHPGFPNKILAYDPAADRWAEEGETPAPRATVPTVEWHGTFVIPSGEVRPGVRSPEVWTIKSSR